MADSGLKTELAEKVNVLETCSDSRALFRVSGSDFETNSKLSSRAGADTGTALSRAKAGALTALSRAGADSVIVEKITSFSGACLGTVLSADQSISPEQVLELLSLEQA